MEDGHPLDSRLQDTTSCNASIEEGVTPKEQKAEKNKRGPVSLIKAATRIITFPGLSRRSKATVATAAATEKTPLVVSKALTQRQSGISSINTSGNASGEPLLIVTSTSEDSRVPVPQGDSNSRSKHGTWGVLAHQVRNGEFFLRTGGPSWDENCNQGGNDDHAHCSSSKHEKRQQAQDEIRSLVEFSLLQCLLAIFAYIAIAVLAFSVVFDHWTVIDSAYFAVVTFCTVGFGDLVPDTYAGRVFTCFFALSGVACLGIALGVVGNNIIEAEHIAVKQAGEISKYRMVTLLSSAKTPDTDSSSHPTGEEFCESLGVPQPPPVVQVVQRKPLHIIGELSLVVVILLLFATVISDDPGVDDGIWDIGTGLYFAIICATTVGYGDFAPQTQKGRLLAIFFIPVAVGSMGHWLSVVASSIIARRQSSFHRRLQLQELSQSDLDIMDDNGDGHVSHAEFLEFMLVAMNKVDKEFIDEMRGHFARLDTDNTGFLSRDDLIANAKRKLQNPHHKLQLANYKQQLLQQAADARKPRRRRGTFWGGIDFPELFSHEGDSDRSRVSTVV